MKKFCLVCSIVFTLVFCMVTFTNNVKAEDTLYTNDDYQYYIQDNTIVIVYYYGNDTNVTVPWAIGDYEVKVIADGTFRDSNIASLNVPANVSYVDSSILPITSYYGANGEPVVRENPTPVVEEDDPSKNPNIEVMDGSIFEDATIDISEDFDDNGAYDSNDSKNSDNQNTVTENPITDFIERVRDSFLYNGAQFASNFASNPIGYVFIGVAIIVLIGSIVYYIRKNR